MVQKNPPQEGHSEEGTELEISARTPAKTVINAFWYGDSVDVTSLDFKSGVFVGLLIGEGHFGGDGRQPQITLRLHVVHEPLFRWIERNFPGGKLFGPYNHSGRHYYQWMARGRYLRETIVPLLEPLLTPELDQKAYDRFHRMVSRYHIGRS